MCDQTEIEYLDGDVVWVKLGSCWWPGEVVGPDNLPPDVLPSFRKPPIAVVKFFQESTYEYVKNINNIYKYNCSRKTEFINKGLYMYRTKHGHMEKFPEDVIRAETAVGGDIEILTRDEFQEVKRESYAGLFGESAKKTPFSTVKKGRGRGTPKESTPIRKLIKEKSDYKVHILVQKKEPASSEAPSTPSTSHTGSDVGEEKTPKTAPPAAASTPATTPTVSTSPATPVTNSGIYACPSCNFSTSRLNVLILHNKTHSATYTAYTPTPIPKKVSAKNKTASPKITKTPKAPRSRKEKVDRPPKKPSSAKKRSAQGKLDIIVKKPKTDAEIKSSLLADWDDIDEGSNDESTEMAVGAESPAVPTPEELPSAQVPADLQSDHKLEEPGSTDKPEASSDSKYEFCEDEDWHVEADIGRKIPRVKNTIRKEDNKGLSLDEDDVAKEVAELLNKTTLPELPSIPEPLKVAENFPEPSIVKSPDKKPDVQPPETKSSETLADPKPTKAIFKTKTFFRSRHSRSQDAIGKYVAEQLNAAERLDMGDGDLNGSEVASSPEARESPPIEPVKVARLAPKIQLKKMKAEAAQQQLREKEKSLEQTMGKPELEQESLNNKFQDVLWGTQEIKPINKDTPEKVYPKEVRREEINREYFSSVLSPKKRILDERSTIVSNELDIVTSPKRKLVEGSPIKVSSDTIEITMAEKYIHPVVSPELDTTISATYHTSLEENCIDAMAEKSTDTCKSLDASPEKPSRQSPVIVTTPKKSPLKVSSPQNTEDSRKSPISMIINTSIQNNKEFDKSLTLDIDNNLQNVENIQNSPVKDIDSSRKTVSEIDQGSPVQMMTGSFPQISPTKYGNTKSEDVGIDLSHPTLEVQVSPQKSNEVPIKPYMSESTASAVDALLSVSRETDKVPKIVSHDLPEDLFEDDHKDNSINDDEISNCNLEQTDDSSASQNEQQPLEIAQVNEGDASKNEPMEIYESHDYNGVLNQVKNNGVHEETVGNLPSESDLQIAEALINLPSTTMKNKPNEQQENLTAPISIHKLSFDEPISTDSGVPKETQNDKVDSLVTRHQNTKSKQNIRFETEEEQSENFSAAQSLVQMSESVDHKINAVETSLLKRDDKTIHNRKSEKNTIEHQVVSLSNENNSDNPNSQSPKFETTSSKLMKMLEEPATLKPPATFKNIAIKSTPVKQMVVTGREKILNFDVAKASKEKAQPQKQKIIIRRAGSSKGFNNLNEVVASPDKIVLSRSNVSTDGSSVQTFTIQGPSQESQVDDIKQIVLQPKIRKVPKTPTKVQKIMPQSVVSQYSEPQVTEQSTDMFDINSMPVVLSDDILTPESIEKMPIVMSDGNIIASATPNPPKLIKTKPTVVENQKVAISAIPKKSEVKSLIMSSTSDPNKAITPNILSKSSKMRAGKPLLVIDKVTGMQKIIVPKSEPVINDLKQAPSLIQQVPQKVPKAEKFILIPPSISPRPPVRKQKIVIDPQTGHVLITKGPESPHSAPDNKSVTAKLMPSSANIGAPGNTVMIITNAQGAQSRIVLTPEHEKILFPNKQQASGSQLKTITHRLTTNTGIVQKNIVTTNAGVVQKTIITSSPVKQQPKVSKQKSAIITSKGQLLVGGRVSTTAQNIAPMPDVRHTAMPEIRPVIKPELRQLTKIEARPPTLKRILTKDPKKLVHTVQKNPSESLIFLRQKSGAVIQLTASQFEHLQRTGQIVQKIVPPPEKKIVPPLEKKIIVQKSITIPAKDTNIATTQKQRVRKHGTAASHMPAKRGKQEICIAPAVSHPTSIICSAPPVPMPVPPLTSLSSSSSLTAPARATHAPTVTISNIIPTVITTATATTTNTYPDLDNFEEMLPSTAIARQPELAPPVQPHPETVVAEPELMIAQPELVVAQPELVVSQQELVVAQQELVVAQQELVVAQQELVVAQPELLVSQPELVVAQQEHTVAQPDPMVAQLEPMVAQLEPMVAQLEPETITEPPPGQLADGQLLAVPGESVGGLAGAFYLCIEDNGNYTPIDNRPLILENNQLVPIAVDTMPVYQQPERRDILEAALANSDVFQHTDTPEGPDFRDLNANVSVHCRVSETSTTLNQPIMTPVEMPTKGDFEPTSVPSNLEDGLAVIGVTPHTVPTSLELPITVTDPRIAPKTTDPLSNNNYGTTLIASSVADMSYVSIGESHSSRGISMPLLTENESVGKSMPILTDDVAVSSVESMECEESAVGGGGWARRLLTPCSDTSDASAEIPLQPHIQLSVADLSPHT